MNFSLSRIVCLGKELRSSSDSDLVKTETIQISAFIMKNKRNTFEVVCLTMSSLIRLDGFNYIMIFQSVSSGDIKNRNNGGEKTNSDLIRNLSLGYLFGKITKT